MPRPILHGSGGQTARSVGLFDCIADEEKPFHSEYRTQRSRRRLAREDATECFVPVGVLKRR